MKVTTSIGSVGLVKLLPTQLCPSCRAHIKAAPKYTMNTAALVPPGPSLEEQLSGRAGLASASTATPRDREFIPTPSAAPSPSCMRSRAQCSAVPSRCWPFVTPMHIHALVVRAAKPLHSHRNSLQTPRERWIASANTGEPQPGSGVVPTAEASIRRLGASTGVGVGSEVQFLLRLQARPVATRPIHTACTHMQAYVLRVMAARTESRLQARRVALSVAADRIGATDAAG